VLEAAASRTVGTASFSAVTLEAVRVVSNPGKKTLTIDIAALTNIVAAKVAILQHIIKNNQYRH
jgi:hypothetical protein